MYPALAQILEADPVLYTIRDLCY
jgi:hypothetical protein